MFEYFLSFEEQIISLSNYYFQYKYYYYQNSAVQHGVVRKQHLKKKKRYTSCFEVTFYWLIGKLSLNSFIPAPNFYKKIRKLMEKTINEIEHSTMVEFQDSPTNIIRNWRTYNKNLIRCIKNVYQYHTSYMYDASCTLFTHPTTNYLLLVTVSYGVVVYSCT